MKEFKPIVYKGQRVITTELLALVYETDAKRIKQNFNRNKSQFKENLHYFKLTGESLKSFKNEVSFSDLVGKNASSLYLWTERGANRHCKILETAKAWEQFGNLEETYFAVKEQQKFTGSSRQFCFTPQVSPGSLARLMEVYRKTIIDIGGTPQDVAIMVAEVSQAWHIPVPSPLAKQLPGQLCMFDQPAIEN